MCRWLAYLLAGVFIMRITALCDFRIIRVIASILIEFKLHRKVVEDDRFSLLHFWPEEWLFLAHGWRRLDRPVSAARNHREWHSQWNLEFLKFAYCEKYYRMPWICMQLPQLIASRGEWRTRRPSKGGGFLIRILLRKLFKLALQRFRHFRHSAKSLFLCLWGFQIRSRRSELVQKKNSYWSGNSFLCSDLRDWEGN